MPTLFDEAYRFAVFCSIDKKARPSRQHERRKSRIENQSESIYGRHGCVVVIVVVRIFELRAETQLFRMSDSEKMEKVRVDLRMIVIGSCAGVNVRERREDEREQESYVRLKRDRPHQERISGAARVSDSLQILTRHRFGHS